MEDFKLEDLAKYKYLSGIKHSPDEKNACFIVHESDVEENKYLSNLYIINIESEKSYKLTSFNTETSFLWLDNDNVIFPDVRNEKDKSKKKNGEEFTQYYKININGGEAEKFLRINKNVNSIKIIDLNTYIFTSEYASNSKELYLLNDDERAEELKARKEEKDYEVIEEIPFWENGGTFTSRKRNRLYIYHVDTDKIEAVTGEYENVGTFQISPEKTKVLIVSNTFKDKMGLVDDMSILNLETKEITKINEQNELAYHYADFMSEKSIVFAATDMKKLGLNENPKFYLLDLTSKESKCITPDFDRSIWNSVGSDCRYGNSNSQQVYRNNLYFTTTEDDSSFLNRIDENGEIAKLTFDKGSVDDISVAGESTLLISMKPNKLQELFKLENGIERKITTFNDWVYAERKISEPIEINVETAPGVTIKGWIMKPNDFDENKKYPAILDIHGGPKTVYGTVFFNEMQYWTSHGYAVFFCNPRGSDGKGNEFSDIRGKYGTIDYVDIMKFMDEVLEKFTFIDKDRVGVTGGSYGGFMTNWIIGHTNRFKVAASQRSIANWISKFGTTDIGYFFVEDQSLANPWDNQEKLWDHSPLKYANNAKTPTLFLHSEEDYRCWIAEGFQMFTALKYNGVDSKLIMFKGENHELSRSGKPKHKIRRLREMTEWFDKYLK